MSDAALDWLQSAINHVRAENLYRKLTTRTGAQGASVEISGGHYVNFASNDYLDLAHDSRLIDAVVRAIDISGWGGGSSPLIVGHSDEHAQLEAALAAFEGTEAALLFPSGFATNAGVIPTLVGPDDTIFSDANNHASIIDGCRLSGADTKVYAHADCADLAAKLRAATDHGRKLIVTDTLFSMDGDLAPLGEIASLADQFGAMLMIDEAHATGVLGESGRGAAELAGVEDRVDIKVGTLSKALGCMGGFVAGSRELIDWITNRCRSYIFSTACPAANCAAGLAALQVIQEEPRRRAELQAAATRLRKTLNENGWTTGASVTQIVPVIVGAPDRTMAIAQSLRERGVLVPGIRPPSVAPGRSLLRISVCWGHTPEMLDQLVTALGPA